MVSLGVQFSPMNSLKYLSFLALIKTQTLLFQNNKTFPSLNPNLNNPKAPPVPATQFSCIDFLKNLHSSWSLTHLY